MGEENTMKKISFDLGPGKITVKNYIKEVDLNTDIKAVASDTVFFIRDLEGMVSATFSLSEMIEAWLDKGGELDEYQTTGIAGLVKAVNSRMGALFIDFNDSRKILEAIAELEER
jgi:hypothetical protein